MIALFPKNVAALSKLMQRKRTFASFMAALEDGKHDLAAGTIVSPHLA